MKNKTHFSILVLVLVVGVFLAACGPVPAGAEISVNQDGQSATVVFAGTVDSIAADQWMIQGQAVVIDAATEIDSGIVVGDKVKVKATITADGKVTANKIEGYSLPAASTPGTDASSATPGTDDEAEFVGVVEFIVPDAWTVAGQVFAVGAQTEIYGTIVLGDTVKIHARVGTDGLLIAREIKLFDPLASGGQGSGPANGELEMTGRVESIAADQWTVSGISFLVDLSTEVKQPIVVGDRVKLEAFFGVDDLLTAREIELADDTDSNSSGSDSSSSGMEFSGVVEALGTGTITVSGRTFVITTQTEIKDVLTTGVTVKVEAFSSPDGTLTAREIKVVSLLNDSGGSGPASVSDDDSGDSSSDDQSDDHDVDKDDSD